MNEIKTKFALVSISGFTLIELLVVISIIGIVMGIVLPNVDNIMGGQSQSQAFNLIDAKLRVARSLAFRNHRYVAVHFQPHHKTGDMWCAIMVLTDLPERRLAELEYELDLGDPTDANFQDSGTKALKNNEPRYDLEHAWSVMPGTHPVKLPSNWRLGAVCSDIGDSYGHLNQNSYQGCIEFNTFSIVFNPEGNTVRFGNGDMFTGGDNHTRQSRWKFIYYDTSENACYADSVFDEDSEDYIWDVPAITDTIIDTVCLYDNKEFERNAILGNSEGYLDENCAFIMVNPRVGGLIRSAVE